MGSGNEAYNSWLAKQQAKPPSLYPAWAKAVGILPDEDGHDTWDHQQAKIDMLTKVLTDVLLGQGGDARDIASNAMVRLSEMNEV